MKVSSCTEVDPKDRQKTDPHERSNWYLKSSKTSSLIRLWNEGSFFEVSRKKEDLKQSKWGPKYTVPYFDQGKFLKINRSKISEEKSRN